MIKAKKIRIEEFRGIRDLTIDFKKENFAICGPNGSGKSGIVDALEFALTGSVSRLAGTGQGNVSVKVHAPHVDMRDSPESSKVTLEMDIEGISRSLTIERSPKNPSSYILSETSAPIENALNLIKNHPEVVLSRRELIKFILTTPGKRAEQVQALLQLEPIEKVRASFKKISNNYSRKIPQIKEAVDSSRINLATGLGIPKLLRDETLASVNAKRAVLGLNPIEELTSTVSFLEGYTLPKMLKKIATKAQVASDIKLALTNLAAQDEPLFISTIAKLIQSILHLEGDPNFASGANLDGFYRSGLDLALEDFCPLCDLPYENEELRSHISKKRERLREIARQRLLIQTQLQEVSHVFSRQRDSLQQIVFHASAINKSISTSALEAVIARLQASLSAYREVVPLSTTRACLQNIDIDYLRLNEEIRFIQSNYDELPDVSTNETASMWLSVAEERLKVYRSNKSSLASAQKMADLALLVYTTYTSRCDTILTDLYDKVETSFRDFYSKINAGDEDDFKAKLIPSTGTLEFGVDFYGRGFFPPSAYHSEGHQDGMGLCLYLALMKHLHGDSFTFVVLDDVLMSVDVSHRREVCRVLKSEFPNTQFILTTHDPVWLNHMKTEGLVSKSLQFKKWSVDQGPSHWNDVSSIWDEIRSHVDRNEIRLAASALRHYLEYVAAELCDKFSAPVAFKADGQYQLGDLLPAACAQFKRHLKEGKNVAVAWQQTDVGTALQSQEAAFSAKVKATQCEQWQINKAIHYNEWANMGKEDFEPVVSAYESLISCFSCPKCKTIVRVVPSMGTPSNFRCACGHFNVNLARK